MFLSVRINRLFVFIWNHSPSISPISMNRVFSILANVHSFHSIKSMSSESSTNISLNDDRLFEEMDFGPECKLEYSYVDGRKEGFVIVYEQYGRIVAKLQYQNDKLHGLCFFNNTYGEKVKEVEYVEDVANGWYRLFENLQPVEVGINRNGKKFSELREFAEDPSFLEEVKDGMVISVCKYNLDHKRDGYCTNYENGVLASVTLFENGIELYKVFEFDGESMIEYRRDGKIVYKGEWNGNISNGFSRCGRGMCVIYDEDAVSKVIFLEDGKEKGYQSFDTVMKEMDENGTLEYEGEFSGSVESGFVRNGIGTCFLSESSMLVCFVMELKRDGFERLKERRWWSMMKKVVWFILEDLLEME